ncbi:MAG: hypothetical protein VB957_03665 [Pseudomonadales bacterium]
MAIGPSMKGAMKDGFSSSLLIKLPIVSAIGLALAMPVAVNAASSGRQLEEVVVTAERQEASVQDTSISITAFTSEMLEDFGIRDQTDLQNFIRQRLFCLTTLQYAVSAGTLETWAGTPVSQPI